MLDSRHGIVGVKGQLVVRGKRPQREHVQAIAPMPLVAVVSSAITVSGVIAATLSGRK